jgi:RimJ/RimL family protein N-acetyltransferase
MEEVYVRTATLNDLDTLLFFEQGIIAAERPFDETLKHGVIQYYDLQEMILSSNVELVVAELNGEIAGCGYARIEGAKPYLKHSQHAYLGFMYVLPQHRGKGIIAEIITALNEWAFSKGITELRLDVYHQNEAAFRAYEKAGFSKLMISMRMEVEGEQ